MSLWNYRSEARGHVWELCTLGWGRPEARENLHALILQDSGKVVSYIEDNWEFIQDLVEAPPSRREAMLRRYSQKDELSQIALILGAWQHARKAVLVFTWMIERNRDFIPGSPYRKETAKQGFIFDDLREINWTRWPFQWGESPFSGEKLNDKFDAPDFDEVIDNFDPETQLY